MDAEAHKEAVLQNDKAHQKTIREADRVEDMQARFAEINREAKMWLRHIDVIHGRISTQ
jgi:hypothetical protein